MKAPGNNVAYPTELLHACPAFAAYVLTTQQLTFDFVTVLVSEMCLSLPCCFLSADAHTDDQIQMAECYSYEAAQSMCTISQSNMPALKYVQIARCTICFVTGSS